LPGPVAKERPKPSEAFLIEVVKKIALPSSFHLLYREYDFGKFVPLLSWALAISQQPHNEAKRADS